MVRPEAETGPYKGGYTTRARLGCRFTSVSLSLSLSLYLSISISLFFMRTHARYVAAADAGYTATNQHSASGVAW